jgi:hypothetical protein
MGYVARSVFRVDKYGSTKRNCEWGYGRLEKIFLIRLLALVEIPAVEDESDGSIKYPVPY